MPETMAPEVKAALDECRWMIIKGSKSFSLAARLFDSDTRDAAFFLYGWCRYCDDQVDQAGKEASVEELDRRLKGLSDATRSAFAGEPQQHAVFIALQYIAQRYSIPAHYALELIEVEYEPLPVVTNGKKAAEPGARTSTAVLPVIWMTALQAEGISVQAPAPTPASSAAP